MQYIFFPRKPKRRGLPKLNHHTTFPHVLPYHSLFLSRVHSKRKKKEKCVMVVQDWWYYIHPTHHITPKNSSISKRSVQLNMESKVGSHFLRCISEKVTFGVGYNKQIFFVLVWIQPFVLTSVNTMLLLVIVSLGTFALAQRWHLICFSGLHPFSCAFLLLFSPLLFL